MMHFCKRLVLRFLQFARLATAKQRVVYSFDVLIAPFVVGQTRLRDLIVGGHLVSEEKLDEIFSKATRHHKRFKYPRNLTHKGYFHVYLIPVFFKILDNSEMVNHVGSIKPWPAQRIIGIRHLPGFVVSQLLAISEKGIPRKWARLFFRGLDFQMGHVNNDVKNFAMRTAPKDMLDGIGVFTSAKHLSRIEQCYVGHIALQLANFQQVDEKTVFKLRPSMDIVFSGHFGIFLDLWDIAARLRYLSLSPSELSLKHLKMWYGYCFMESYKELADGFGKIGFSDEVVMRLVFIQQFASIKPRVVVEKMEKITSINDDDFIENLFVQLYQMDGERGNFLHLPSFAAVVNIWFQASFESEFKDTWPDLLGYAMQGNTGRGFFGDDRDGIIVNCVFPASGMLRPFH